MYTLYYLPQIQKQITQINLIVNFLIVILLQSGYSVSEINKAFTALVRNLTANSITIQSAVCLRVFPYNVIYFFMLMCVCKCYCYLL